MNLLQTPIGQEQLAALVHKFQSYISSDQINKAMKLAAKQPYDVRERMTKPVPGVCQYGALYVAIDANKSDFLKFLVEECHANLEEEISIAEDKWTPLLYAVYLQNYEVVKQLLVLGANVFFVSPVAKTTAVHLAAIGGNLRILCCLCDNRARLNTRNAMGCNALTLALHNTDVCRILLEEGDFNVNEVDNSGHTALHYAAGADYIDTVKLLMDYGADPYLKDGMDYNAIQSACSNHAVNTLNFMSERVITCGGDLIGFWKLMGAFDVDRFGNAASAFICWKQALAISEQFNVSPVDTPTPHPAYDMAVEFDSEAKLDEAIQTSDSMIMQALLLREKVLGTTHYGNVFELVRRAAEYLVAEDFSRGMRLFAHALNLCRDCANARGFTPQVADLVHQTNIHFRAKFVRERAVFRDDLSYFDDIASFLEATTAWAISFPRSQNNDLLLEPRMQNIVDSLMELILCQLLGMCCTRKDESQTQKYKRLMYHAVKLNLRDSEGMTLLIKSTEFYYDYAFNADLMLHLVECFADVEDRDVYRNTALHRLKRFAIGDFLKFYKPSDEESEELKRAAGILIENGAHIDARNAEGWDSTDYAVSIGCRPPISLMCIAARAIRAQRIPNIEQVLPKPFWEFVRKH